MAQFAECLLMSPLRSMPRSRPNGIGGMTRFTCRMLCDARVRRGRR